MDVGGVDLQHVVEVAAGNIFVAGASWGAIRAQVQALNKRMDRADTQRDAMEKRIDGIFESTVGVRIK